MPHPLRRRLFSAAAGASILAIAFFGFWQYPSAITRDARTGLDCLQAVGDGPAPDTRQRAFAAASKTYGVPPSVLLGVSYLQSRWDDHGAAPSTSGGYGPMHLTEIVEKADLPKGDRSLRSSGAPGPLPTIAIAADLTDLDASRLKSDDEANICGGAAVLASYQRDLGNAAGAATSDAAWYDAVKAYSGEATAAGADRFAQRVFTTIKGGRARTTNDGQKVQVASRPALAVPSAKPKTVAPQADAAAPQADAASHIDCPKGLSCEWIPAPYEQFGATPSAYGNHDIADREDDLDIDYIVIHNTEASYARTLQLVQDPTYVSWNYTIRSRDGHVAQHLDARDVGFQAGNWYVNTHSIGIEHEGFAAHLVHRGDVRELGKAGAPPGRQVLGQARPRAHHRPRPGAGNPACRRARHALGPGPVLGLGALHEPGRCPAAA